MNRKTVRIIVAVVTAVLASALIQQAIAPMELNQWIVAVLTIVVPVWAGGFVASLVAKGDR